MASSTAVAARIQTAVVEREMKIGPAAAAAVSVAQLTRCAANNTSPCALILQTRLCCHYQQRAAIGMQQLQMCRGQSGSKGQTPAVPWMAARLLGKASTAAATHKSRGLSLKAWGWLEPYRTSLQRSALCS